MISAVVGIEINKRIGRNIRLFVMFDKMALTVEIVLDPLHTLVAG